MYKISDIYAQYKEKLITADEAAAMVNPGDRVHFGTGCGVVNDLDEAIAKRVSDGDLEGIEIVSTVPVKGNAFKTFQATEHNHQARFASAHFNGFDRQMNKEGRCWYIPIMFSDLPYYWFTNGNNPDIAMFQVTPMDAHGNFNLGPQVSDMRGVIKGAKKIIVEVNENMPLAYGHETQLNIHDIDFVVEGSNKPLAELPSKAPSEIDKKIAKYVVEKIEDGSTLQLGIGSLPGCIGSMLADEADITGINAHTEMMVDAYLDLYNAGKLTGNKPIDHGKYVYTFAGGSKELYEWIDGNPSCCAAPVSYVNSIQAIAQIPKFISINSCIQVDLFGQVCSETAGFRQVSGTGGQLDFVMGAWKSEGGHSFLCTPAARTLPNGELESLISPTLKPGSIVTTPRMCTNYVVTEYGAVNLKGKSTWERAELLISVAHPDFRDQLIKDAEKMGIWKNTSKLDF